jgi:hypothetical protein
MADIEIEIDGNVVKAKAGEMLIAVTDREGIKQESLLKDYCRFFKK